MPSVADYTALGAAAETLRALLQEHITDSDLADLTGVTVDLRSPQDLLENNITQAVSVWLYRVAIQPDMLNAPPRPDEDGLVERYPLPLELYFLITALHGDAKTHLALTGRVLQLVNDHARIRGGLLKDSLAGTEAELRLSVDATTIVETSDLWYSLQSPFRLGVPVRMQVTSIASHLRPTGGARVMVSRGDTRSLV
jgi:hypothetical protein